MLDMEFENRSKIWICSQYCWISEQRDSSRDASWLEIPFGRSCLPVRFAGAAVRLAQVGFKSQYLFGLLRAPWGPSVTRRTGACQYIQLSEARGMAASHGARGAWRRGGAWLGSYNKGCYCWRSANQFYLWIVRVFPLGGLVIILGSAGSLLIISIIAFVTYVPCCWEC